MHQISPSWIGFSCYSLDLSACFWASSWPEFSWGWNYRATWWVNTSRDVWKAQGAFTPLPEVFKQQQQQETNSIVTTNRRQTWTREASEESALCNHSFTTNGWFVILKQHCIISVVELLKGGSYLVVLFSFFNFQWSREPVFSSALKWVLPIGFPVLCCKVCPLFPVWENCVN